MTERAQLDRSFQLLQARASDTAIGVVVNAVKRSSQSYNYDYGYSAKSNEKGS